MLRPLRVLVFALLACLAGSSLAVAADKPDALVKLDDAWSKAAGAKDIHTVVGYYAEDAQVYPPNDVLANGRAAAEKVWASYFALPSFSISWKTMHAGVSKSGDLGYTSGTYQDSYADSGGKTVNEAGKYVCIWAKQKDGSWKAIHDIWNSDTK